MGLEEPAIPNASSLAQLQLIKAIAKTDSKATFYTVHPHVPFPVMTKLIIDLLQPYSKPSSLYLLEVLLSLKRSPRSWNQDAGNLTSAPNGEDLDIAKYLISIIASSLQWIDDYE